MAWCRGFIRNLFDVRSIWSRLRGHDARHGGNSWIATPRLAARLTCAASCTRQPALSGMSSMVARAFCSGLSTVVLISERRRRGNGKRIKNHWRKAWGRSKTGNIEMSISSGHEPKFFLASVLFEHAYCPIIVPRTWTHSIQRAKCLISLHGEG